MRGGLFTSVMLHAAILGWALFTIQAQRELRVAEPEPIAVDLVSAGELTRLRQGVRTAKQLEAEPKEAPRPSRPRRRRPSPPRSPPRPRRPRRPPPKEEPKKEEPPKEVAAVTPPPPASPPGACAGRAEEARRHAQGAGAPGGGATQGEEQKRPRKRSRPSPRRSWTKPRRRRRRSSRRSATRRRSARKPRPRRSSSMPRTSRRCSTRSPTKGRRGRPRLPTSRPRPRAPCSARPRVATSSSPPARRAVLGSDHPCLRAGVGGSRRGAAAARPRSVTLKWRFKPDGTPGRRPQVQHEREICLLPYGRRSASGPCRPARPSRYRRTSMATGKTITWDVRSHRDMLR